MTSHIQFPLPTLPVRLPAGFDHQIDRANILIMEAFGLATRDEILAAAQIMGLAASDGTIISNDEIDNARIVEWTAFHIRRDGKPLIQILLERMPSAADKRDRAILSALATSAWGIYRIETIQPQVGAVVVDLWRQTRHVIYSRSFQNGMQASDALFARRVAVGDITTVTALISRVPAPFLNELRKLPGFANDAALAQDQKQQELIAELLIASRSSNHQIARGVAPVANGSSRDNRQRNQPCPCGSGKKWKYCCGRNA